LPNYYAFRIFLNDTNDKGTASVFRSEKEKLFTQSLLDFSTKKKRSISHYGEVLFLFNKTISNDIHLWQVTKNQEYTKPILDENEIIDKVDVRNPYVYIMIHSVYQIALIEHDNSVFADIKTTAQRLSLLLSDFISEYNIMVNLNPINDILDVKYELGLYDKVNSIDMIFDPPNLWHGEDSIDDLVDDAHEATRFLKMKVSFINSLSGLTINVNKTASYLSRLASGAGQFIVKGIKDGAKDKFSSFKFQVKKLYKEIPENLNNEKLEEDFKTIHKLNDDSKE